LYRRRRASKIPNAAEARLVYPGGRVHRIDNMEEENRRGDPTYAEYMEMASWEYSPDATKAVQHGSECIMTSQWSKSRRHFPDSDERRARTECSDRAKKARISVVRNDGHNGKGRITRCVS
jgi:hypothetical protein